MNGLVNCRCAGAGPPWLCKLYKTTWRCSATVWEAHVHAVHAPGQLHAQHRVGLAQVPVVELVVSGGSQVGLARSDSDVRAGLLRSDGRQAVCALCGGARQLEAAARYLKLAKPVAVNSANLPFRPCSEKGGSSPPRSLCQPASLPPCQPACPPRSLFPLHGLRVVHVKNTLIA